MKTKRWKPKDEDLVWYVNICRTRYGLGSSALVDYYEYDSRYHYSLWKLGNMFPSEQEAIKAAKKIRSLLNDLKQ
jgi:hypothetical protein